MSSIKGYRYVFLENRDSTWIRRDRKGVTVAKKAMLSIESRLERTTGLKHWFIKIASQPQTG
ncbi:MAG: hypothetical protein KZQ66_04500 [Candidatus Thiodiazotropha sp. (ex Lucinoma aequizonata)]|nr:hypothetical protein [Candidatus Thiodiazotropha sp. (ex Lucinoma aequizonata)]MCU7888513.1 hypothetical protein [Candidatus Thiodiazotropha sp. (ex Lucinoma aequizonata)]MCU7895515.1 hypothetical protein [Candidatus Thiodiazotropha sp. (ex Lucinoma aequizonata)]MCU7899280.1 hypothetical protein [Candidatus Thiodiazotropha sp. (ex Lucinoma aequizonata)]MCU7901345.1 hypothetical protein [Candidatus Thiodiazotropha sp. (ex Lucinoma aequizonata)]